MTQAATLTLTLQPVAGRHVFVPPEPALQLRRAVQPESEVLERRRVDGNREGDRPLLSPPVPTVVPHRLGVAVGVAIAATVGTTLYQSYTSPLYKSTFELVPVAQRSQTSGTATATTEIRPEVDQATLIQVLRSQQVLLPAVRDLRAYNINLSPAALAQSLEIVPLADGRLEVRYRHRSERVAQMVSRQLAQTYVDYGDRCRLDACHALQQVRADLTEATGQVARLEQAIAQFQARPDAQNLSHRADTLTRRTAEFMRYLTQTEQELKLAQQRYQVIQTQLSFADANRILQQQADYQALLQALHQTEGQIATTLTQAQPDAQTLQALYQRHQLLSGQMNQQVAIALEQFLLAQFPELAADPETLPPELSQIEQAFGLAHQVNLLSARQRAIAPIHQAMQADKLRLAELLQYQSKLETQLVVQRRILQESQQQHARLQQEISERRIVWRVAGA
ncbi:hypothetical protein [Leptolyngbya sp. O-77]|uniref:hypothetical protein n=1 Tax=Leptolyngbya sp. O-77 TaxID=1080068 RepID=UPI00074D37E5|nr:hypothetical protein [Leptolyngbya sp. O-77]BAU44006.1 hypothetical protein O77CONTIG1_03839 [Leptolyngbya sp. O-77]